MSTEVGAGRRASRGPDVGVDLLLWQRDGAHGMINEILRSNGER